MSTPANNPKSLGTIAINNAVRSVSGDGPVETTE